MPASTNVGLRSSARLPIELPVGSAGQPELFTCKLSFAAGVPSVDSSSHFCSVVKDGTGLYTLTCPTAGVLFPISFEVADSDNAFGAAESHHNRLGDLSTSTVELKFFESDGGTLAMVDPPNTQTAFIALLLYPRT